MRHITEFKHDGSGFKAHTENFRLKIRKLDPIRQKIQAYMS